MVAARPIPEVPVREVEHHPRVFHAVLLEVLGLAGCPEAVECAQYNPQDSHLYTQLVYALFLDGGRYLSLAARAFRP